MPRPWSFEKPPINARAAAETYMRSYPSTPLAIRASNEGWYAPLATYAHEAAWYQAQIIHGMPFKGYSAQIVANYQTGKQVDDILREFQRSCYQQAALGCISVSVPTAFIDIWKEQTPRKAAA